LIHTHIHLSTNPGQSGLSRCAETPALGRPRRAALAAATRTSPQRRRRKIYPQWIGPTDFMLISSEFIQLQIFVDDSRLV